MYYNELLESLLICIDWDKNNKRSCNKAISNNKVAASSKASPSSQTADTLRVSNAMQQHDKAVDNANNKKRAKKTESNSKSIQ